MSWCWQNNDIVACQRGEVSNKPPGQRQDTGPGILWSVHRWTRPTGESPKRNEPHIWFAFFTKTRWAWHVTIYTKIKMMNIMCFIKYSYSGDDTCRCQNRADCSVLAEIAKTCVLLRLVKYFRKIRGNGLHGSCLPSFLSGNIRLRNRFLTLFHCP